MLPPATINKEGISLRMNIEEITAKTGSPIYIIPAAVGSTYTRAFVFIITAKTLANNAVNTMVNITIGCTSPEKVGSNGINNDDNMPTTSN